MNSNFMKTQIVHKITLGLPSFILLKGFVILNPIQPYDKFYLRLYGQLTVLFFFIALSNDIAFGLGV